MNDPSLPSAYLLTLQADWLQPARSRLLRRVGIAHKRSILDLGAGYGAVSRELARRSGGYVWAFDKQYRSLHEFIGDDDIFCINGAAPFLPVKDEGFDLVFSQCTLLWMGSIGEILKEVWRVLKPGGHLIAMEPDYGGLIEWPKVIATRHLWISSLINCGADPFIGRKLPVFLKETGFDVDVHFMDRLTQPSPLRFDFLKSLPLTVAEDTQLTNIMAASQTIDERKQIAHLPFFLIIATRSD